MPRTPSARSHAARTCQHCKRGKRRCELPSTSQRLEGGVTLRVEDSCKRCQRLQIPCILDATYRYAHLHSLTAAPTPPPPIDDPNEPPSPVKAELLHTHPKSVEDYHNFFPRFLPFALLFDFYTRTLSKLPPHPCLMDAPDQSLDELVNDENAHLASEWCQFHVTFWLPFTPSLDEVRRLRRDGDTSRSLLFLEAAQLDLAIQHGAFPISPTNHDKIAIWTASYCRDLIASPVGTYITPALLMAAWFLPLVPDNSIFRQISSLALDSCQDQEDTLETRISRMAACTLIGGATLADDDHFYEQSAALQLPTTQELDELEADIGTSTLSNLRKAGCHGVVLRCRTWVAMKKCVVDMGEAHRRTTPEAIMLADIDSARMEFSRVSRALCVKRGAILSTSPLSVWLDFENWALEVIAGGYALHFTLGDNFSPQTFYDVTTRTAGSVDLQNFLAVHGPLNEEATMSMLAAVSNLPTRDVLYPTTLTFAHALRGVIMALEIHASWFKLWRQPPEKEPVWSLLLRTVDDTLRRLKGGGGQIAARIVIASTTAARETIRRWRAELVSRPYNPSKGTRASLTPDTPKAAAAGAAGTPGVNRTASVIPSAPDLSTSSNGFEPVAGFESQGFDPMVHSFAEWIAGIDWNQFVMPE